MWDFLNIHALGNQNSAFEIEVYEAVLADNESLFKLTID